MTPYPRLSPRAASPPFAPSRHPCFVALGFRPFCNFVAYFSLGVVNKNSNAQMWCPTPRKKEPSAEARPDPRPGGRVSSSNPGSYFPADVLSLFATARLSTLGVPCLPPFACLVRRPMAQRFFQMPRCRLYSLKSDLPLPLRRPGFPITPFFPAGRDRSRFVPAQGPRQNASLAPPGASVTSRCLLPVRSVTVAAALFPPVSGFERCRLIRVSGNAHKPLTF